MRTVRAILGRELKAYFFSPVAYVVLTGFTALSGWLFYQAMERFIRITTYVQGYKVGGQLIREWTLEDDILIPLFRNLSMLLLIMVPAITMRLFAEEKKLKTMELLLTSPVRLSHIVLGKYLAAVVLLTVMLAPVALFPAIIAYYASPAADLGPVLTGYVGLFLAAYALAAMGLFASTLSENQIVAFILGMVLEMVFFSIGLAAPSLDVVQLFGWRLPLGQLVYYLSLGNHFDSLTTGLFRLSDLIYFGCLIVFWLAASNHSVESARWG
jgi:ABC-2 type transport system permease protein